MISSEEREFTCASCKRELYEVPGRTIPITLCQTCEERRKANAKSAPRPKKEKKIPASEAYKVDPHKCGWCRDTIVSPISHGFTPHGTLHVEYICDTCKNNRNWLRRCIENSPRAAAYVFRTETRCAAEREEKQKQAQKDKIADKALEKITAAPEVPADIKAELDQMKKMMAKMIEMFGAPNGN